LQPDFVEALSNLGAALTSRGEGQEAARFLNKANALRPNSSEIIFNMGRALQLDGKIEAAIEKYQRALVLAPNSMHIIGKLADSLEMANRLEEAQALIDRELPRAPDTSALLIPAAKLARRAKKIDEAIALFERAMDQKPEREIAGDVHLQLGQLYDKKNDADRAYAHIAEGNRLIAQSIEGTYSEHNDFIAAVEKRHRYLNAGLASVTPFNSAERDAEDPVFLYGFARSGTTLLGQILDCHPALQTLDEKGMGTVMVKTFEEMAQGRTNAIEMLTEVQIAQLRKVYFDEAARHIQLQPGSLLVDKMPLNTINVALIWRVFPRAKIIFMVRHPCDVCLSCFMQNFGTNGALTSFFALESGVSVYAKVMQIWLDAVRMLPLQYHQIRYEDLVTDFERESHSLLDFLGVGWNESVREHDKHAMSHSNINTPSYHQVTQPVYQHAKYRWKRYAKQFEPLMPILQPYIEYFGY
jgi:tetratricopeptide (TPR) repeat protein